MSRLARHAVSAVIVLVAAGLLGPRVLAQNVEFFRIATGTTVGTYFPIGRLIASAITNPPGSRACEDGGSCGVPGLIAVAHSTQGALQNIQMIGRGRVESGFVQADLAHLAFLGDGPFQGTGPLDNLRTIAKLYSESVHVVVRRESGIIEFADLAGRRISIGSREGGTTERALAVLAAHAITGAQFIKEYDEPARAAERLRAGQLDAMIVIDGYPVPVVADLAGDGLVDLLAIEGKPAEKLLTDYSYFRVQTIPGGAYRGIGSRATVGVDAHWLTSAEVDPGLVYRIAKALWNPGNRKLLDGGHPKGRRIRLETALDDLAVPLHDGARRFYREQGLLD
jgi:hypothetical protein